MAKSRPEIDVENSNEPLGGRPDPNFKAVTVPVVEAVGIEPATTELPQTLTADLVLKIPATAKIADSMFSFLAGYDYAVLDFKSENDPLDMPKLALNVARTALVFSRQRDTQPERVLNLIVSSRKPQELISRIRPRLKRNKAMPWLWEGGPSYQPLTIVVCRYLPLEPKYAEWLTFFPSDSKEWPKVIRELLRMGRRDLVELMVKMRPKEFSAMSIDFETDHLTPEERERLEREYLELGRTNAEYFLSHAPDVLAEITANLPSQQLARSMRPQVLGKLAQVLDSEQVSEFLHHIDPEKVSQAGDVFTVEQLEAMLRRKKGKEQNH